MGVVSFSHHERVDNGRRTGLTVDGERALERYVPGDADRDPVLRWFVNVVFPTDTPPANVAEAKAWLLDRVGEIEEALLDAAEGLRVGLDADGDRWGFERAGPGGPMILSVVAMRDAASHDIAERIRRLLRDDWVALLEDAKAGPEEAGLHAAQGAGQ